MITERQKEILNGVVEEYIKLAQPISSQLIGKKYRFGVSPATIRAEMQKLTAKGYLCQPHTSAGRIPTDKGYRFYVDSVLESNFDNLKNERFFEEFEEIEKETKDILRFSRLITKALAKATSSLALSYLTEKDLFWKEGWEEIFREPEFRDADYSFRFVKMIECLEREINRFIANNLSQPKVYIGRENPIRQAKDFSMVLGKCSLLKKKQNGVLVILGPKRMDFAKNISLMNSVIKLLEEHS